jgi:hypothetical protein
MKPPTVRLHAYLFAASLSAIVIQIAVLVSILLLHVPERAFETLAFRVAVVAAVGGVLLVVRELGRRAAREDDSTSRTQSQLRASRASMHAVREPLRFRHRRGVYAANPARAGER